MPSPYEELARSMHRALRTLAVRTGPKISSCAICGARWRTREWHNRTNCAAAPDYLKAKISGLLAARRLSARARRKIKSSKLLPSPLARSTTPAPAALAAPDQKG